MQYITSTTITPELAPEEFCPCGNVLLTDDELENGLCDECADAPLDLTFPARNATDCRATGAASCLRCELANVFGPPSCSDCRPFENEDARRAVNFTAEEPNPFACDLCGREDCKGDSQCYPPLHQRIASDLSAERFGL